MQDAPYRTNPLAPSAPTVIGPGSTIRGEMAFEDAARIEGSFEGTLSSKTELHIGEAGSCRADLDAATVIIDGSVEGNVVARECLQLNATARVSGDIAAATLVVVQGAVFVGHCRIGPDAVAAAVRGEPATAGAKPRSAAASARALAPAVTSDLEATLAGLESRLAGLGKSRTTASAAETT